MRSRKKSLKKWSVAEKLEIVQAMERGLTYREILTLYGLHSSSLVKWNRASCLSGENPAGRRGVGRLQRTAQVRIVVARACWMGPADLSVPLANLGHPGGMGFGGFSGQHHFASSLRSLSQDCRVGFERDWHRGDGADMVIVNKRLNNNNNFTPNVGSKIVVAVAVELQNHRVRLD